MYYPSHPIKPGSSYVRVLISALCNRFQHGKRTCVTRSARKGVADYGQGEFALQRPRCFRWLAVLLRWLTTAFNIGSISDAQGCRLGIDVPMEGWARSWCLRGLVSGRIVNSSKLKISLVFEYFNGCMPEGYFNFLWSPSRLSARAEIQYLEGGHLVARAVK